MSGLRLALLIGNDRYFNHSLVTPVSDVRMLADLLTGLGFAVQKVENAGQPDMRAALERFVEHLNAAKADAVAFLYFAGHGCQDEGINYLLGVDADLSAATELDHAALTIDEIVRAIATRPRKANVIVLDTCRMAPSGARPRTRDLTEGLTDLKLPPEATMLVAYSTSAGTIAADTTGRSSGEQGPHSPYAAALQRALPKLLEPDRRIHDVFVEAAEWVSRTTGASQSPALYLQGVAPPLGATDADRMRFKTWVRGRRTWREIGLQIVGTATLAGLMLAGAMTWFMAYPETRSRWLYSSGLASVPTIRWTCEAQGRIDRFMDPGLQSCNYCWRNKGLRDRLGLTVSQWCELDVHEIVNLLKREKKWDASAEFSLAESGDIIAMTLLAAARQLSDSDEWYEISDYQRRYLAWAMRAASAGWLPAWPIAQRLTFHEHPSRPVASPELLAGLLQARSAGILPARDALRGKPWDME